MNIATIGSSWITEKFISAAKTVSGINISACYSRTEENAALFAKKNGIKKYYCKLTDLAEDKTIDAVYIASPNVFHYEQSKFFLQHGKNVLCEKPATCTLKESQELFTLAEERGLIFAEAIMSIHTDAFDLLKNEIKSIGNIFTVNLLFAQLSSKYNYYIEGKNPNIFNPEFKTGCLMDIGVYNLYIAAALFGMPEKIISRCTFLENGADAQGTALLCYNGFTVNAVFSKVGQGYAPSEIIGDKGTISVNSISQLTGISILRAAEKKELIPDDLSRDEVMCGEARFFAEAVEKKDYNDASYLFAKKTALAVREMCDTIRSQNNFLF